jgi:uncharacterized protein (DUF58 family)
VPLWRVRISAPLPEGLRSGEAETPAAARLLLRDLSVPAFSEITVSLPVEARRRGEYRLDDAAADASDPFGLVPVPCPLGAPELLVLPAPRVAVPIEVRRRLPFGAPATHLVMYEQPERFAGVRPYAAGDPLNRVHWKLTGHSGQLQIKLFEPTRSADVLFALDLSLGEPFWSSVNPHLAEDTIGWTSFLARLAVDAGWRIGLIANTHLTLGRGPLRVPPSSARGHEAALFAAMARMPNQPTSDLAPLVRETGRRLGLASTLVVLSPQPGPWLEEEMSVVRKRGIEVVHVSPLEVRRVAAGR